MIRRLRERLLLLAHDSESGAAMVEFAVVFPLQLVLTLLLIQFAFLANAHMVVQHAAFNAARAAAVADGMTSHTNPESAGVNEKAAAIRAAARTLAMLTVGVAPEGGGAPLGTVPALAPLPTDFRWATSTGARSINDAKQNEAYSLLRLELGANATRVGVTVEYDYVMAIPVAGWIMAGLQGIPEGERVKLGKGFHPFRIRRKAYVAKPWGAHPQDTSSVPLTAAPVAPRPVPLEATGVDAAVTMPETMPEVPPGGSD